jgi:hypothetical protein
MGDFVAVAVTPEREKRFAFSVPIQSNLERTPPGGSRSPGGFFSSRRSLLLSTDLASRRRN